MNNPLTGKTSAIIIVAAIMIIIYGIQSAKVIVVPLPEDSAHVVPAISSRCHNPRVSASCEKGVAAGVKLPV